jgi:hypothetical protein
MLDAFDPTGKTQFFAAIQVAQGILRDKTALKAFEQSQVEPVDELGNSVFISGIAAPLDTILDQTFHAMRGMTGKDLRVVYCFRRRIVNMRMTETRTPISMASHGNPGIGEPSGGDGIPGSGHQHHPGQVHSQGYLQR